MNQEKTHPRREWIKKEARSRFWFRAVRTPLSIEQALKLGDKSASWLLRHKKSELIRDTSSVCFLSTNVKQHSWVTPCLNRADKGKFCLLWSGGQHPHVLEQWLTKKFSTARVIVIYWRRLSTWSRTQRVRHFRFQFGYLLTFLVTNVTYVIYVILQVYFCNFDQTTIHGLRR